MPALSEFGDLGKLKKDAELAQQEKIKESRTKLAEREQELGIKPENFRGYETYQKAKKKAEEAELHKKLETPFDKMMAAIEEDSREFYENKIPPAEFEFTDYIPKENEKLAAHRSPTIRKAKVKNPDKTPKLRTPDISTEIKTGDQFITPDQELFSVEEINSDEVKIKSRLGEKTLKKEVFLAEKQEGKYISKNEADLAEHKLMLEIAEILKKGVDRVVIHGEEKHDKDKDGDHTLDLTFGPDFDTLAALYLINNSFDPDQTITNIPYKEGATSEIVFKGTKTPGLDQNSGKLEQTVINKNKDLLGVMKNEDTREKMKEGGVILHLDTGGRKLSIERDGKMELIYVDHHPEKGHIRTSATKLIGRILEKGKMMEGNEFTERLIKYTTDIDNISFVDKKRFDKSFYKNKYPKTLYALREVLPFKEVIKLLKEKRDFVTPFTDEELETMEIGGKKLKDIIEKEKKDASHNLYVVEVAVEKMKKQGILGETEELGKVVYNTMDKQIGPKGQKKYMNRFRNKDGFAAVKASGYDTFINYDDKTKRFFVNSTTKDLAPLAERLKAIVPGVVFVRGVMILPPMDRVGLGNLDRMKFLQLCGLADENTKLEVLTVTDDKDDEGKEIKIKKVSKKTKADEEKKGSGIPEKIKKEEEAEEEEMETKKSPEKILTPEEIDLILANYVKKLETAHPEKLSTYKDTPTIKKAIEETLTDFPVERIEYIVEEVKEEAPKVMKKVERSKKEETEIFKQILTESLEYQEDFAKAFEFEHKGGVFKRTAVHGAKAQTVVKNVMEATGIDLVSIKENKATGGLDMEFGGGIKIAEWGWDNKTVEGETKEEMYGDVKELVDTILNSVSDEEIENIIERYEEVRGPVALAA